jgi:hypothetical protein
MPCRSMDSSEPTTARVALRASGTRDVRAFSSRGRVGLPANGSGSGLAERRSLTVSRGACGGSPRRAVRVALHASHPVSKQGILHCLCVALSFVGQDAQATECGVLDLARGRSTQPNKAMKLTKLSPAPLLARRCRLMRAKAHSCARTASQLIAGVRLTGGAGGRQKPTGNGGAV